MKKRPSAAGRAARAGVSCPGGAPVTGFLHMPKGEGPFPVVLMCGGLDALQTDYYNLYENYFAPLGIAMLTLDMPSIGFSSKWTLTQDTSLLHQHAAASGECAVGRSYPGCRVRFPFWREYRRPSGLSGAAALKAVACLGPVVHGLLVDPLHQGRVPEMYLDVLASRLGMHDASDEALRVELNRYSLKTQGCWAAAVRRRCCPASGKTIRSARKRSRA
jgi:esterase FrsA